MTRPTRPREHVAAYAPCVLCGVQVLSGVTTDGTPLHLDPSQRCFMVAWSEKRQAPLLFESRAYPVHQCRREDDGTRIGGKRKRSPSLGTTGETEISPELWQRFSDAFLRTQAGPGKR